MALVYRVSIMEKGKTRSGTKSIRQKKKKNKVIHHGVAITRFVKHIDRAFLFWTLFIGIGEFLVTAWPATALGVFGVDAMMNFVLFVYAIRGILLIYAALSAESIYLMHGMEGVKGSPFRVFGAFRDSWALAAWWIIAYIIGGIFGAILTITVAATYTWYSCKLLYGLSVGFYAVTTLESFVVPTFMYRKAIHENVTFYMRKVQEKERKRSSASITSIKTKNNEKKLSTKEFAEIFGRVV